MAPETSRTESRTRERNRVRIVEAARHLWVDNPDATMDDVARAAGVVRRTLYGHFADREELIAAVVSQAGGTLAALADQHTYQGPDAASKLARMTLEVWSYAHDTRLLLALARRIGDINLQRFTASINAAFTAVIDEGQRNGEFSDHLPAHVMTLVLEAQAITLHEAFAKDVWISNADSAAVAALVTVGVNRRNAASIVARVRPDG